MAFHLPRASTGSAFARVVFPLLLTLSPALTTAQVPIELPEGFFLADSLDVGTSAVSFTELPDGRILTVGHTSKRVELIVDEEPEADPIFTMTNVITSSEQGVLGIAIDPDFPDSSWVYIFYTHVSETNRVSRFRMTGDLTDGTSTNLSIEYPEHVLWFGPSTQRFHNGGTLRFGSDKTLYISHGDDALSTGNVQNLEQPHGKILRINRDGTVPPDNPVFPDAPPGALPEIFAFGFRNPFRFCIDPETGRLLVGDVGGDQVEELSLVSGGENMGYPYYEGSEIFRDFTKLIPPEPTFPVHEYAHGGTGGSHAMIALACYRPQGASGSADFPPEYDGAFFWTNFFGAHIHTLRPDGNDGWVSAPFGVGFSQACDAALARDGGIWILRYGTSLTRIAYQDPVPVVFLSFDAVANAQDVRLSWRTAVEASRFEVLRGSDGISFERVGTVEGQPGGVAEHRYVDAAPGAIGSDVYYRIDAIGENATISSPVVRVSLIAGVARLTLFPNEPNPFESTTRIAFGVPEAEAGRRLRVEIYDVTGRRVRELLETTAPAGTGAVMWDGRDGDGHLLASGVYFSRLSLDEETTVTRSIVLRR